ncbi:MAG: cation diffusion facilitator family transporter [Bacteroidetes bacterium]|nr:cation diffusion facilitator family transporter [Bacteroidota bacterium]
MAAKQNIRFQKLIAITGVVLFCIKIVAWYLTNSLSVLTDALESIVNVITGFVGLYSLYLAALPRDRNHPYGHGKVEFVSAAIEGTMIGITGLIIIYKAITSFNEPSQLNEIDFGIILVSITAIINSLLGYFAVQQGKSNNSAVLIATGKHLQTDTYTTLGIVLGLTLIYFTDLLWLDSVMAILFAGIIIFTGIRIVRTSLAGIMDESDFEQLEKVVEHLQEKRKENWIDLHNLRLIKFGSTLHLDCHLTVPWYLNVNEAHQEVDSLEKLVRDKFGESVELFIHTDGCVDFSCKVCSKTECPVRKFDFVKRIDWTLDNAYQNNKHRLE